MPVLHRRHRPAHHALQRSAVAANASSGSATMRGRAPLTASSSSRPSPIPLRDWRRSPRARRQRPAPNPQRPQTSVPPPQKKVFHPSRAVHALLEAFPDAIWFDESGLSTSDVRQWMNLPAGEYLINGSGGIGWGLAASVGAAIGNPEPAGRRDHRRRFRALRERSAVDRGAPARETVAGRTCPTGVMRHSMKPPPGLPASRSISSR